VRDCPGGGPPLRTFGLFGAWLDLAPDDSPMVLRHTSSQQI
jgi:hypothetical protein